jgi:hypothetical protein
MKLEPEEGRQGLPTKWEVFGEAWNIVKETIVWIRDFFADV